MSMFSSTNQASNSSLKTLKLKIEKIVFGGSGLSRNHGCVVFTPFVAPGEEIEATILKSKKDYKLAKILKILTISPDRRKPPCPYFTKCGGCQLQHLEAKAQLKIKQGFLEEAFGTPPPIIPSPKTLYYRSHLRFNLEKQTYGFKACDNTSLVEVNSCSLFLPEDSSFFTVLRSHIKKLSENGSFRIFKGQSETFVLAFSFPRKLPKNRRSFITALMKALPIRGIAMKCPHGEEHSGDTSLQETICGLNMSFSPYGFIQNNKELSATLYETLVKLANPKGKTILDLYSGIGTTSLLLAKAGGSVTGVEESSATVKCANLNKKRNHIEGVSFLHMSAEEALKKPSNVDLVVVNPPRTGLSKDVREALVHLEPHEILYISCMPSTLKRDIKDLKNYIYNEMIAFDLFPQTTHLETLVKMTKKNFNR